MRPGRPSKQRLWVGAHRYCGCCRDTATNSASSDSYTTNNSDSMRPDNPNADAEFASSYTYAYAYAKFTSSHSYADTYAEFTSSDPHADTSFKSNSDANTERASTTDATQGDTKASAESASPAVRPG